MSTRFLPRNKKGFTLIELLIVITIIGILAVALIPRVSQGPAKARDVKRKADINNITTAVELYYSDVGSYPTTSGCVDTALSGDLSTYMQALPTDPGAAVTKEGCNNYYYYSLDSGSSYALFANLEIDDIASDGYYCYSAFPTFTTYADAQSSLNGDAATCVADDPDQDAYYVVLR
ncbi:MAG: prepilin-type N-terminal cleavage/methylation domain-containing protein [Candidatus Gracilibacteria bacterium]